MTSSEQFEIRNCRKSGAPAEFGKNENCLTMSAYRRNEPYLGGDLSKREFIIEVYLKKAIEIYQRNLSLKEPSAKETYHR